MSNKMKGAERHEKQLRVLRDRGVSFDSTLKVFKTNNAQIGIGLWGALDYLLKQGWRKG